MPLCSSLDSRSEKHQRCLEESWAGTFQHNVFLWYDERPFAVLYSDEASCPNVSVNVLVGFETLRPQVDTVMREQRAQQVQKLYGSVGQRARI